MVTTNGNKVFKSQKISLNFYNLQENFKDGFGHEKSK
jgi:hypothetical protein